MISKEELVKNVAKSCGISPEVSLFFFEVFVNRLSNKLKPGDLLHFDNFGYFHKRNCRIQLEKTPNSPTPKSYLIQLVLFTLEPKVKTDLSAIQFLKIPNLKTLWIDDPDFKKSLKAGDFAPHSDRNQLIKAFATTSEVIISGLRKDFDSELVEELIIPLTFDLNFLIKTGQKSIPSGKVLTNDSPNTIETTSIKRAELPKDIKEPGIPANLKSIAKEKESTEEGLPWNYGNKFLEKDKVVKRVENNFSTKQSEFREKTSDSKQETDFRKEQEARLKDFEPVSSYLSASKEDIDPLDDVDTIKFSMKKGIDDREKIKETKKFTEVKSKTEAYRHKGDFGKSKKGLVGKYLPFKSLNDSQNGIYRERRSILPLISILAFIIIGAIVVYIYVIKEGNISGGDQKIVQNIKPASNVNVIERDYEIAVTYPYAKNESRILISGYNRNLLSAKDVISEVQKEVNPEIKQQPKTEKISDVVNKPKIDEKKVIPVLEEPKVTIETKEEKSNRIFLYKNYYVVQIGTFKSEETANREADRYFNMGYNAIIEVVESRNGATMYKLIVGDFTSEEFARQFQEKYIK